MSAPLATRMLAIAVLIAQTHAIACSVSDAAFGCTFAVINCKQTAGLTRSPCTLADGDFTYAEFNASRTYCISNGMNLVTPLDGPTVDSIAHLCPTTFFNTKWTLSSAGKCIVADRDDDTAVNTLAGAFWSNATNEPTKFPDDPGCTSYEPCTSLYCSNSVVEPPEGCVGRAHDRSCGNYGPPPSSALWRGVQCLVCGKRPLVTMGTTVTKATPSTSTKTTKTDKPTKTDTVATLTKPSLSFAPTPTTRSGSSSSSTGAEATAAASFQQISATAVSSSSSMTSSLNQPTTKFDDGFVSAPDSRTIPLDNGAIAGIVIAGISVLMALIVVVALLIRRRKRKAAGENDSNRASSSTRKPAETTDLVYGSSGFSQLT